MNQFSKQSTVQTSKMHSISKKETKNGDNRGGSSVNFTSNSAFKAPISIQIQNKTKEVQSNEMSYVRASSKLIERRPLTRDFNNNRDLVFEGITLEQYFQHRKKGLANALKSQ